MDRAKIQEVYITALKVTHEDDWLKNYINVFGDSIKDSPHYQYLLGNYNLMESWMKFRNLKNNYVTKKMMETLQSLIREGQKEPILIYKDMRINTGHKRAACLLFLGKTKIKAKFVEDDYKL